ncbi:MULTISPECIES: GTPase family protein [unclassified Ectothiorhodospira]|uniref:GTPase family protein n=1 Tax=unclassified Ectothiorhodospira TaxID=2684909 RepID=UPI001EE7A72F|nr:MULTISPECIES: GTPase domain-containing protein [unclassified Ectothiorhodospira]MCG5514656.1 50S ribosome-binding GTPase [Ectothiorhodospira sp. 9100]MCG5517970.1 50S ribosome-binding GTPase [Ectothiorhodospira sp. 9905]
MNRPGTLWPRWGALVAALAAATLPFLILIPLGAFWLWQQGWLLIWLGIATGLGLVGYTLSVWLQRRAEHLDASTDATDQGAVSAPDTDWSPRDMAAWESVQKIAAGSDPHIVGDYRLLLLAGRQTIEQVARHYHPEERHPMWRFTVPEALLVTERVSVRLRRVMLDKVPGSHLIRASQLMRLWDFQPAASTSMRWFRGATRVYRAARLVNPLGAVMAEARERMVSMMMGEAGDYLRRRGARIWVEEVGRAAIELYSGRLRIDTEQLDEAAAMEAMGPGVNLADQAGPIRITVAGQANAGKSSLINCLLDRLAAGVDVLPTTQEANGYLLERNGLPEAVLVDTPGLQDRQGIEALVDTLWESDYILWVVDAHRADRALDGRALEHLRQRFAADPRRILPPILVVLSHVDRLSPPREWDPPYDLEAPARPKAQAMRQAMEAISKDLGVAMEATIPARLDVRDKAYNVDTIWERITSQLDRAQRGRAMRILLKASPGEWKRVLKQTARAGAEVTRRWMRSR